MEFPFMVMGILCLLYTSDAADERSSVDLGGRRIIKKKKIRKKKKKRTQKKKKNEQHRESVIRDIEHT